MPETPVYQLQQVLASADELSAFFAREFAIDPGQLRTETDGRMVRVRSVMPGAEGRMEVAQISAGFTVTLMDAVPQAPSVAAISADGVLFARLLVCGHLDERIGADQLIRLRRPVCTLTYLPAGVTRTQWLRRGERRRYFGLAIHRDRLLEAFGWTAADVPGQLQRIYSQPDVAVPLLSAMPASWSMQNIYASTHDCPYSGPGRAAWFRIKALELLLEAAQANPLEPTEHRRQRDPRIDRAAAWVDANLSAPLTLDSVGHRIGVNRNVLAAGFRNSFGLTFHDYVQRARMHHAWNRLSRDGASVAVVATETGFRSRPGFSRAFGRCFGVTPKSVRRR